MRKISQWVEAHLWVILATGFALYGGYVTGMTTTSKDIAQLQKDVERLDRISRNRQQFMVCSVRNFDRLFEKTKAEPACPMEVPE